MAVATVGERYLLIGGKYSGHSAVVEATDPDGRHCFITIGDKLIRYLNLNMAMTPAGTPIAPPGGFAAEIPASRQREPKAPRPPGGTPQSKQGAAGQPNNPYRGRTKPVTDTAEPGEGEEAAPPKQAIQPIAAWPKKLPPFTLADVEITERTPGPTFHELYQLDLLTGEGVGLVWRSKADGLWHVLGGAGSAFTEKIAAINYLVQRRQPTPVAAKVEAP